MIITPVRPVIQDDIWKIAIPVLRTIQDDISRTAIPVRRTFQDGISTMTIPSRVTIRRLVRPSVRVLAPLPVQLHQSLLNLEDRIMIDVLDSGTCFI